jgi:endo-alpha-1,4-polygalactosaminidase (GH114 family)
MADIKRAYHALALDEHREAFSPTLWHLPEKADIKEGDLEKQERHVDEAQNNWYVVAYNKKVPLEERKRLKTLYNEARRDLCRMQENSKLQSELLQVWFPGVHINIGGGSSDTLKNEGDLEGNIL